MARGIGDVVDAYLGPRPRAVPTLNLLVLVERDAWVASAVAIRLLEAVSAPGSETAITALDPPAGALVGFAAPRARGGRIRLNAEIATTAGSARSDCVLSVIPVHCWPARVARPDGAKPAAMIGLGARGTGSAGAADYLATIPERDAVRLALGAGPCAALGRAALALERWLRALHVPALAAGCWPGPPWADPLGPSPPPRSERE